MTARRRASRLAALLILGGLLWAGAWVLAALLPPAAGALDAEAELAARLRAMAQRRPVLEQQARGLEAALQKAQSQGVTVVRTTRCARGPKPHVRHSRAAMFANGLRHFTHCCAAGPKPHVLQSCAGVSANGAPHAMHWDAFGPKPQVAQTSRSWLSPSGIPRRKSGV
jgi:hypothetical protein